VDENSFECDGKEIQIVMCCLGVQEPVERTTEYKKEKRINEKA
jgi:hypothetical protein